MKSEKSKMPFFEWNGAFDYLRDFGEPNHERLRTENDEQNEKFPTHPKSAKLNFSKNTQFSLKLQTPTVTKRTQPT